MPQEQLKEKVQKLEVKQAITDSVLGEIKEDLGILRVEVKSGFKEIQKFILKLLCWVIGILLTALGYYIKMKQ